MKRCLPRRASDRPARVAGGLRLALLALLIASGGCVAPPAIRRPLPHRDAVSSDTFRNRLATRLNNRWVEGNRIAALTDGAEVFPAMLAAIRSARQTINLETYIYENGRIPNDFAEALAERARAGVKVNLLFDAFGSSRSSPYHGMLQAAGARVHIHHPLFWLNPQRWNYRTHRKLLIVDGKVGFIGGIGISDQWAGNGTDVNHWHDTHYRVEGPVVAQLQAGFASNWRETGEKAIDGPEYYPPLRSLGSSTAAVALAAPRTGRFKIEEMYHQVIAAAEKSIYITNPYFIPGDAMTDALCQAAARGVQIVILTPGSRTDSQAVRRASKKRWSQLLAAGIHLYEYQPAMLHTKRMIVDGLFTSVGSANFDPRSLRINDEANLNVLDRDFARRETRLFAADLRRSQPVNGAVNPLTDLLDASLGLIETPIESQL